MLLGEKQTCYKREFAILRFHPLSIHMIYDWGKNEYYQRRFNPFMPGVKSIHGVLRTNTFPKLSPSISRVRQFWQETKILYWNSLTETGLKIWNFRRKRMLMIGAAY